MNGRTATDRAGVETRLGRQGGGVPSLHCASAVRASTSAAKSATAARWRATKQTGITWKLHARENLAARGHPERVGGDVRLSKVSRRRFPAEHRRERRMVRILDIV